MIVHESDQCVVWSGDAEEYLSTLPNESVGLIVTDPPYGIDYQSNARTEPLAKIYGDTSSDEDRAKVRSILQHCVRVVGQGRHLYVFGPPVLEGLKVSECVDMVWDKGKIGMGNLSAPWGPEWEPITFAVSKFRHAGQVGNSTLPTRMRKGSVLRFRPPTGRAVRHPNEKPVPLLWELIESSSRVGDTVLDPFGGSGATAVAAVSRGRKAVVCESDPASVQMILSRVASAEDVAQSMSDL